MSVMQTIWLAIVQGLTEFLPVSSSGHLILFAKFTSFEDQGLAVDIALHVGSLLAVMIYFHKDILQMLKGVFGKYFLPDFSVQGNKLAYLIVIASIPALILGFWLRNFGMESLRSARVIGWNILIYGLILCIADKYGKNIKTTDDIGGKQALLIGLAQCLALIPGTSRSGITITMARFLGINRSEAAKFSMLLSIPTILAAGALETYRLWKVSAVGEILDTVDAIGCSFIASIIVIFGMMKWLKKFSFLPFVIYRVVLGMALILYSYGVL